MFPAFEPRIKVVYSREDFANVSLPDRVADRLFRDNIICLGAFPCYDGPTPIRSEPCNARKIAG